jgi:hypothetical protein
MNFNNQLIFRQNPKKGWRLGDAPRHLSDNEQISQISGRFYVLTVLKPVSDPQSYNAGVQNLLDIEVSR